MNQKLSVITVILLAGLAACKSRQEVTIPSSNAAPVQATYRVKRVADGDTITVVDSRGTDVKVRFACIDAAEVPHTKRERESYNPSDLNQFKWGRLARNRLTQLLHQGGERVALTIVDTDRYGRTVAEVRLPNGTLTQEALVREGLVMVNQKYIKNCPSAAVVKRAEAQAKQKRLNIWGNSQFMPPWEWRRSKKS